MMQSLIPDMTAFTTSPIDQALESANAASYSTPSKVNIIQDQATSPFTPVIEKKKRKSCPDSPIRANKKKSRAVRALSSSFQMIYSMDSVTLESPPVFHTSSTRSELSSAVQAGSYGGVQHVTCHIPTKSRDGEMKYAEVQARLKTSRKQIIGENDFNLQKESLQLYGKVCSSSTNLIPIARLYYAWLDDGIIYQLMEDCGEESLAAHLSAGRDLKSFTRMAYELCNCLFFLHDQGLIHRDIKPENIMMPCAASLMRYALIDFDMLCTVENSGNTTTSTTASNAAQDLEGDARYLGAADMNDGITQATDIYALGKTLASIFQACVFEEEKCKELIQEFIISTMMHENPNQRPTAAKCVKFFGAPQVQYLQIYQLNANR